MRIPRNTGIAARLRLVWIFRFRRHFSDLVAILRPSRRGDPAWLVRIERRFAPTMDQFPALTSASNTQTYFKVNLGGDKMSRARHGYAPVYAELLAPWIDRDFVLVELGVFRGSSLALWHELFPKVDLLGLDIEFSRFDENLATLRRRGAFGRGIPRLLEFDAFEPDILGLSNALAGRRIGIFIDDGPHASDAIIRTARAVIPMMDSDFLYVVEDNPSVADELARTFPVLRLGQRGGLVWLCPLPGTSTSTA